MTEAEVQAQARDARRRWWGLFFLILAAGWLIWGETVFRGRLSGMGFVAYWLPCFVFTTAAILIALRDLRSVRQRIRTQQRRLFSDTFAALDQETPPKPMSPSLDEPPGGASTGRPGGAEREAE